MEDHRMRGIEHLRMKGIDGNIVYFTDIGISASSVASILLANDASICPVDC